jgi:long-subunit fatty acid transport protein
MIKKLIIAACLLLSVVSFAQQGTLLLILIMVLVMLYKGTAEIRSMAGIAVEQDSIHLNIDNPASYSNLKQPLHLGVLIQLNSTSVTETQEEQHLTIWL